VPAGINDDATSIAFDFPNPIPINATDLQLQVVYRGPLGSEPDAVAVATRDISEPTYIYQYSSWDQYLYAGFPSVDNGPNTFQQWCAQGYPTYDECRSAMGLTWKLRFSATPGYTENPAVPELTWYPLSAERPFSPVFTIIAPVGTYGRVAILADIEAPPIVLVQEAIDATHGSAIFNWIHETLVYTRNQFDAATNGLIPSTTYVAGRGIFVQTADGFLLNSGTAPNIPPLVPVASQINF
jgi:hypothetical protein